MTYQIDPWVFFHKNHRVIGSCALFLKDIVYYILQGLPNIASAMLRIALGLDIIIPHTIFVTFLQTL